jgi:hypothetical protein
MICDVQKVRMDLIPRSHLFMFYEKSPEPVFQMTTHFPSAGGGLIMWDYCPEKGV